MYIYFHCVIVDYDVIPSFLYKIIVFNDSWRCNILISLQHLFEKMN
jgi:hypothetical protein